MKYSATLYKTFPLVFILSVTFSIWIFGFYNIISFETIKTNQDFLLNYTQENKIISVITFIVFYFVIITFAIPVGIISMITAGFLFGKLTAVTCVVIGGTLGSSLTFASAKRASKKEGFKGKAQDILHKNAFIYVIILRLMPFLPFVMVNLMTGMMQVPFRSFFFGTLIGLIPITLIYVSIGASMQQIIELDEISYNIFLQPSVILPLIFLAILSLSSIIFEKVRNKSSKEV